MPYRRQYYNLPHTLANPPHPINKFDRLCYNNITHRPRQKTYMKMQQISSTIINNVHKNAQDVRNIPNTNSSRNDPIFQLISLMTRILDRMSRNHAPNNLSRSNNKRNWTDPKDTRHKAENAFLSQFAKTLVPGKFGAGTDTRSVS